MGLKAWVESIVWELDHLSHEKGRLSRRWVLYEGLTETGL
jgi:hypothetical protein